jgi:hypothetical protein
MGLVQLLAALSPQAGGVLRLGVALHTQGSVEWAWLPRARDVAEFLSEEARIHRLPRYATDRLMQLARAASEVEELFFEDGDGEAACLGYYVVRLGHTYKVFVVVAYHTENPGVAIEAIDIEEWATVARARQLARLG